MWQIMCLCLPALTIFDQLRFYTLLLAAMQAATQEQGPVDLSLCFLPALTTEEALIVLEERRDLVVRALIPFVTCGENDEPVCSGMQLLMQDHLQIMLEAELAWLDRALHRLHGSGHMHITVKRAEEAP
jgi:hypothetical protein